MHKKIYEAIKYVVDNSPLDGVEIYVQPKDTGGFWAMALILPQKREYYGSHIKTTAEHIGQMYGEGLHIHQVTKRVILID